MYFKNSQIDYVMQPMRLLWRITVMTNLNIYFDFLGQKIKKIIDLLYLSNHLHIYYSK